MVTILKKGATKEHIRRIRARLSKKSKAPGVKAYKYAGKISLKEDALDIQKKLRNEWG